MPDDRDIADSLECLAAWLDLNRKVSAWQLEVLEDSAAELRRLRARVAELEGADSGIYLGPDGRLMRPPRGGSHPAPGAALSPRPAPDAGPGGADVASHG